jgi:hypothetical protein
MRVKADVYRGKFNFAFSAEMAERGFQRRFQRNSFRLFALRHGYYHCLAEEKDKGYTRFETSAPGYCISMIVHITYGFPEPDNGKLLL